MSDDLKPPSGPAKCPACSKQVTASTLRPFVEFESVIGRCECGNTTAFGSDEWVMFPKPPCLKCVAEVEHTDCPCTSAQFQAFQRAERKALADLRPIVKKAHDDYMAQITPKMLVWRNHQLDTKPVPAIERASSGELAYELQARGWNVDGHIKRSPGRTGTLNGLPSIPMARILEQRCGECVQRPAGAK